MKRRRLMLSALLASLALGGVVYNSLASAAQQPKQFIGLFKVARANFLKEGPKPEDMPAIKAHVDYWQKYADQGLCQLAGHTLNKDDSAFGLALVRTESEKTARELMDADPMVKSGILSVTVFPFEGLEAKQ
jgi:uncharacterized protein YciI